MEGGRNLWKKSLSCCGGIGRHLTVWWQRPRTIPIVSSKWLRRGKKNKNHTENYSLEIDVDVACNDCL
jgi:hypothetical protein